MEIYMKVMNEDGKSFLKGRKKIRVMLILLRKNMDLRLNKLHRACCSILAWIELFPHLRFAFMFQSTFSWIHSKIKLLTSYRKVSKHLKINFPFCLQFLILIYLVLQLRGKYYLKQF